MTITIPTRVDAFLEKEVGVGKGWEMDAEHVISPAFGSSIFSLNFLPKLNSSSLNFITLFSYFIS